MEAIEFETISKDGMIKIPDQYREFLSKPVKVILLRVDEPEAASADIDKVFDRINLDLSGYKFDRDEANERYLA
jgi:uncharacterized protein YcgL (UPF0745 family)